MKTLWLNVSSSRLGTLLGLISRNECRQAMTVDPEGRVRVFTRARWPVMVAAWLIAVVLITLLTSRVIHVVGRQLSFDGEPAPPARRASAGRGAHAECSVQVPPSIGRVTRPHRHPHRPSTSTVSVSGSGLATGVASRPPSSSTTGHRPVPSPKVSRPSSPPPAVTDQRTGADGRWPGGLHLHEQRPPVVAVRDPCSGVHRGSRRASVVRRGWT